MLDNDTLKTKIALVEQQLAGTEVVMKLLREIRDELKEQSTYHLLMEEIRQLKKSLGDHHIEYADEFEILRESLQGTTWPMAVEPGSVPDSESGKEHRAENIIQFVVTDYLKDLKFLDYGTGEGHVVPAAATQETTISVGYDIKDYGWDRYEQSDKYWLTTEWEKVKQNGPYDVILMFDVLDHAENEDPIQILRKVKDVLKHDGKLYIKCHPWSSKHGTHLYEQDINKAYAHLIFDEVELSRIYGKTGKFTLPVTHPVQTYRDWFKDADWEIDSEYVNKSKIEKFFLKKEFVDRISKHYPKENDFQKYISIDAIDYVLKPKENQIW